jgi:hypothetical protein
VSHSFASEFDGVYSSDHKDMKCSGEWSHPFLPTQGKLNHGTPDGALIFNESKSVELNFSEEDTVLKVKKVSRNGSTRNYSLQKAKNKSVKISFANEKIYLAQKRLVQSNWDYGLYLGTTFNQRFMAVLSLDENRDLVLENFSSYGLGKLKLKKRCILPRI